LNQSYVLDTSALLNLVRGKELGEQIDRAFALKTALYRHSVCIVTHGEILALADRNNWGEEKRNVLAAALDELVTVNVDSDVLIASYVQVEAALRTTIGGEPKMGHNDMWIAATALMTGLPLITTDKDFNPLDGRLIQVHWVDPTFGKPGKP